MICFRCGEEFRDVWKAGKLQALNVKDNRLHWLTCEAKGPNRQRVRALRKRKRQASMFPKPTQRSVPAITGAHYKPSCGRGCIPWEVCACSASFVQIKNCTRADASNLGTAERLNEAADERLQLALLDE